MGGQLRRRRVSSTITSSRQDLAEFEVIITSGADRELSRDAVRTKVPSGPPTSGRLTSRTPDQPRFTMRMQVDTVIEGWNPSLNMAFREAVVAAIG